jgi:hypothetical protein
VKDWNRPSLSGNIIKDADMSEHISDPLGTAQMANDFLAAEKRVLSTGKFFENLTAAARIVSAAQMAYGQALMRANALLFGAFLPPSAFSRREVRPSVAAKMPDPS